jgi:hypothetical protein
MADKRREVRIVSKTPGFTPPIPGRALPELGDREADKNTFDGWMFLNQQLAPGTTLNMGLGRLLGNPMEMRDPHTHDVDEVVCLISMRPDSRLGCDVEFDVDGETYTFTDTTMVFVPAGLVHCPLRYKNFDQTPPYMYLMHVLLEPDYVYS